MAYDGQLFVAGQNQLVNNYFSSGYGFSHFSDLQISGAVCVCSFTELKKHK
jgi:hypothetical protein